MNDQQQAQSIAYYFREQEAARHAKVEKPSILDEQAPSNPAARAAWEARREEAETAYTAGLMGKSSCALTDDEKKYLGGGIARYLRSR
jgi:hypothetical protein